MFRVLGDTIIGAVVALFAASQGVDLGPVLVAVIAAAAGAGGALLTLGPRRKNIIAEAANQAVETMMKANADLERRLAIAEKQLANYEEKLALADRRIFRLEQDLEKARAEGRNQKLEAEAKLAEALADRDKVQSELDVLRREVQALRTAHHENP